MHLRFLIIAFGASFSWVSACGQADVKRCVVLQAAELTIGGKTNVNTFSCTLRKNNMSDTLAVLGQSFQDYTALNGLEIVFNVADFGCDMALMTSDFRKLLKSDLFPQIRMRIDEIQYKFDKKSQYGGPVSATVSLLIAGERGVEYIRNASLHRIQQRVIFTGTHEILMTQFKISPPTKMFGAVRAEDQLEIGFAIQIQ